jgi:hypothetical protein
MHFHEIWCEGSNKIYGLLSEHQKLTFTNWKSRICNSYLDRGSLVCVRFPTSYLHVMYTRLLRCHFCIFSTEINCVPQCFSSFVAWSIPADEDVVTFNFNFSVAIFLYSILHKDDLNNFFHLLSYQCLLPYRYFGPNSEWSKSSSLISKFY